MILFKNYSITRYIKIDSKILSKMINDKILFTTMKTLRRNYMRTIKRELFSVAWKEKISTLRELGFHTHVFMHYAIFWDYQMFARILIK